MLQTKVFHLGRFDDRDRRRERREKLTEEIGRILVVGSAGALVVYLFTVFLESYLPRKISD